MESINISSYFLSSCLLLLVFLCNLTMVRAPTLTTGIRAHIIGPRGAGNPPPCSSTPPRPPDLEEVRRKRIQIAREQAAEHAVAWCRELEKTMASFKSEFLNELRQFRLELITSVMEQSVLTSSVPIISLRVTQSVSSGLQFGTIESYKPPPPPQAMVDPYPYQQQEPSPPSRSRPPVPQPQHADPYGYELQQPPPPPTRPLVPVHALGESPSPAHMRYTHHSLSNGDFD
ncbi:hypothetical protein RchiOBHm_Chr7g0189981 [Rosa chinensis]|uniref:Uncharacterized protein n=1 Tax=Rosa chinensis TaxID=74649 RepID=A0A2P6P4W0_ROSCH|nr:hypothetical protein RchiOBHm_Chr7g0189981 [Rosa chinensis]